MGHAARILRKALPIAIVCTALGAGTQADPVLSVTAGHTASRPDGAYGIPARAASAVLNLGWSYGDEGASAWCTANAAAQVMAKG